MVPPAAFQKPCLAQFGCYQYVEDERCAKAGQLEDEKVDMAAAGDGAVIGMLVHTCCAASQSLWVKGRLKKRATIRVGSRIVPARWHLHVLTASLVVELRSSPGRDDGSVG